MKSVWIAGNYQTENRAKEITAWKLLGVCVTAAIAEDLCFDNFCFVAELPLNEPLENGHFEHQYYPRRREFMAGRRS